MEIRSWRDLWIILLFHRQDKLFFSNQKQWNHQNLMKVSWRVFRDRIWWIIELNKIWVSRMNARRTMVLSSSLFIKSPLISSQRRINIQHQLTFTQIHHSYIYVVLVIKLLAKLPFEETFFQWSILLHRLTCTDWNFTSQEGDLIWFKI